MILSNSAPSAAHDWTLPDEIVLLDSGAGLAQLTEALLEDDRVKSGLGKGLTVVCGDTDESLIEAVKEKVRSKVWQGVSVKRLDAMVRRDVTVVVSAALRSFKGWWGEEKRERADAGYTLEQGMRRGTWWMLFGRMLYSIARRRDTGLGD